MADKDREKKADEDEDESTGSEEQERSDDDSEEGEEAEEKAETQADEGEEDAAAQRVAASLGVGGEEEGEAAGEKAEGDAEEAPAPQNRAARRAEASQRRKKRKAAAPAEVDDVDADLPKDKNARAKELLKRRREQAAAAPARPVQLLPSEMVDDALARSASAVGKWLRANFNKLQYVIVGAAVIGGGWAFFTSQGEKKTAGASDVLYTGVRADRGRVMAEDKRSEEEKELDPTKVFKTADERADTALASFRKVAGESAGTGTAILAKLGEGGALLDKRDWAGALEAYSSVASSTLAGADTDVKARALEGLGFAKEGKKDLDGAMSTFKELEGLAGYKELGQYHQGRIFLAKGDKDKAKELLKQVHDALEKPSDTKSNAFLKRAVEETLRRIDPSLVPAKAALGGGVKGDTMSQEDLERALQKLKENLGKMPKDHHE